MSIKKNENKNEDIKQFQFQIIDWNYYHEIDGNDDEKYIIQIFGRTLTGKDVCLKITDFTPFFYVKIPPRWTQSNVNTFIDVIKDRIRWRTKDDPKYHKELGSSLIKHCIVKKQKFYNFHNGQLFNFVQLIFKSLTGMRAFSKLFEKPLVCNRLSRDPIFFQRYESNIEPHIRFMHINNLQSCGWVTIDKSKLKQIPEYSSCDHSYAVNWKYVKPYACERIAPIKILLYDIECVSCDCNFPQAERKTDEIIQIGMTMAMHGNMNCYERHILTLKQCDKIPNANVECYMTEKELLRGWAHKVKELRPDIRAGYNIFGFDDIYIYNRIQRIDREEAEKRGTTIEFLENKFLDEVMQILGKVNNKYLIEVEYLKKSLTSIRTKNLSSSAYGDNEYKFFDIPGIIPIDVMKVIQRDHKLVGYSLDNVSANFINEMATKITSSMLTTADSDQGNIHDKIPICIYTRSTKALSKGDYIQIIIDDGYSSSPLRDRAKYRVDDIEIITDKKYDEKNRKIIKTSYCCIKTSIDAQDREELKKLINLLDSKEKKHYKIFWTFAKDDMNHILMNEYFVSGEPQKIKEIAKYCLKDCELVNLLLAKLEIIVNIMGMANVCHIPLSYLLLRGQGVKIFSLVAKKCRQRGFLIPHKKEIEEEEDERTYEGAAVIDAVPGVYIDPIGVLDYNSLYPKSEIESNLSHECYVKNPKYYNLPGYVYHDIDVVLKDNNGNVILNVDGTPKKEHHKFIQTIITENEINTELKEIFDKIRQEMEFNIESIKKQTYYTYEQYQEKLKCEEAKLDSKIKEIKNNPSIQSDEKDNLIDIEKKKFISAMGELYNVIEMIKEKENKINEHNKLIFTKTDLSDEEKNKMFEICNEKLLSDIKSKVKEIILPETERNNMIERERERAKKRMDDEKLKVYNISKDKKHYVRYGILPEILTELLNKRKETNARLAIETDPFIKCILHALQIAYKLIANSLYGQTGSKTSPISFLPVAESTTAVGRKRLYFAKDLVEKNFIGSEIIYGDSVTFDTPIICRNKNEIFIKTIDQLGCNWQPYPQFKLESTLNNKQQTLPEILNIEVWTSTGWAKIRRIIRHMTNKKIYRVSTGNGCVDVTEDHSLLDENGMIIKPTDCTRDTRLLHYPIETKINSSINITSVENGVKVANNKLLAQQQFYQLKMCGYRVMILEINDIYYLFYYPTNELCNTKYNQYTNVRYLRKTSSSEYVYDLETSSGTFLAGIGELIVKNTDSIFINFHIKDSKGNRLPDKEAIVLTINYCKQAAKLINDHLPSPQCIVYEKTFFPFILVAKKKYAGLLYETDPNKCYLKSMGTVLKRRDNAPIVKIIVGGIINHILENRNINAAISYAEQVLNKLMKGEYPMSKFIISKTLRAKYKKPSTIAHKVLADRMAIRDPGNKPHVNDRIPYVYFVNNINKKNIKQGELIEHPDYIVQKGLKIDYLYYLEHQIINPASQILSLMMSEKKVQNFFDRFIIEEQSRRIGRQNFAKWMMHTKEDNLNTKKIQNNKDTNKKKDNNCKNETKNNKNTNDDHKNHNAEESNNTRDNHDTINNNNTKNSNDKKKYRHFKMDKWMTNNSI